MKKRVLVAVVLLLAGAVVFTGGDVFANFADTYGISASGIARGNAMAATARNWSAVYYNISGLGKTLGSDLSTDEALSMKLTLRKEKDEPQGAASKIYKDELAVSYMYTYPMLEIDIPRNDVVGADNLNFGTITLGLVLDINHLFKLPEWLFSSARFGLGMGIMQDASITKVYDVDLRTHDYLRYGREAQRLVAIAGLGFGFMKDLFGVGFGASILAAGKGAARMEQVEVGPGEQIPQQQTQMDLGGKVAPVAGVYFSPGKLFPLLKGLEVGAQYRGEIYMEIDPLPATAELSLMGLELSMVLIIMDFYTPHIVTAGVSYTLYPILPGLTVSADCDFQMWSRYKVSRAKEDYIEKLQSKLAPGDKDFVALPDFKDIFVPKVGVSLKIFSWLTASAGYSYRMSYVPDEGRNRLYNFLESDTHIVSAGVGVTLPKMGPMVGPLEIHLTFQGQIMPKTDVKKETPPNLTDGAPTYADTGVPLYDDTKNPDYSFGGFVPSGMLEVIYHW
jgi:hypothetical protein